MNEGTESRGLVVVVEDEPAIADLHRRYLSREGYGVHVATDGVTGLADIRRLSPVAIVLDLGLPGRDGIEVLAALRGEQNWTPVLVVTARDEEVDKITGLELGADDYVTKPFSPRELVARIRAILRRQDGRPGARALEHGSLRVDPERRTVTVANRPVALTATEFNLLEALLAAAGRTLGRSELLARAWGQADYGTSRTVDVHVAQLRAKLGEASPIETVRGVGYRVAS